MPKIELTDEQATELLDVLGREIDDCKEYLSGHEDFDGGDDGDNIQERHRLSVLHEILDLLGGL